MNSLRRQRWRYRFLGLISCALMLLLLSFIPVRLAICADSFRVASLTQQRFAIAYDQAPHPQAILTLGGGVEREIFTAQFAKANPSLEIWVSSGLPREKALAIFRADGISDARVHLDYRALDTVTNFTTLVADFNSRNIQHLYLITSDFHMPRAKAIATIVLGSQGIAFTPVSIPSNEPAESKLRILRDTGRALLWMIVGRTGASFNPHR